MNSRIKFDIISEAQKYGVSLICKKYNISRTIYYRWLKRYKALGIDGLSDRDRNFTPANKTSDNIEQASLQLFKSYPSYGPKAIKYLLEEIGYHISESAVYNIMKRHNLTNKQRRMLFSRKSEPTSVLSLPSESEIKSGECWIFWITNYGTFDKLGSVFEYTFYDYRSKIAATRLYNSISFDNLEELLSAVIIPIAHSLKFDTKYLCFFPNAKIVSSTRTKASINVNKIFKSAGLDVNTHILTQTHNIERFETHRNEYTYGCLSFLMPYIHDGITFDNLKSKLQGYIREYNLHTKTLYGNSMYSPLEFHTISTKHQHILPLWAYMERSY